MHKKFVLNCMVVMACMQSSLCLANGTVVAHEGTEGDVWVTEGMSPNIIYADSACNHLSKSVLLNIVADADAGVFNWKDMHSASKAKHILDRECKRLENEEIYRITGIDRNKK